MTKKMLDNASSALEAAVKTLRSRAGAPTKKVMTLDEFVVYAEAQLAKAAKEVPASARQRLVALKRNVAEVSARVAKLSAEDLDGESMRVEVTTAFAPLGGAQVDGLTTAVDQSSSETAVTAIGAASGDSAFAENLKQVAKTLAKLTAALDDEDAQDERPGKPAKKKPGGHAAAKSGGWPQDMSSTAFREATQKADDAPTWGYDPDEVGAAKDG